MARYTQKQIDKFNRQKYITELEKVAKNLFKMFRDENVNAEMFSKKFKTLKQKLDEKEEIQLDAEYHRQLKEYIGRLYRQICCNDAFDERALSDMKVAEMSNLNRLQKMKNGTSYKKEKHKSKFKDEDWG